jgi:hypothetical protein
MIKPCFPEPALFYWQAKPDDGRAGVLLPPPGSAAYESCGQPAPQAETADHSNFCSKANSLILREKITLYKFYMDSVTGFSKSRFYHEQDSVVSDIAAPEDYTFSRVSLNPLSHGGRPFWPYTS